MVPTQPPMIKIRCFIVFFFFFFLIVQDFKFGVPYSYTLVSFTCCVYLVGLTHFFISCCEVVDQASRAVSANIVCNTVELVPAVYWVAVAHCKTVESVQAHKPV